MSLKVGRPFVWQVQVLARQDHSDLLKFFSIDKNCLPGCPGSIPELNLGPFRKTQDLSFSYGIPVAPAALFNLRSKSQTNLVFRKLPVDPNGRSTVASTHLPSSQTHPPQRPPH